LANDADLAALGEVSFGAGRPYDDVVYVTLSTGVGAGVVLGGRLVHSRRSLAEVGHIEAAAIGVTNLAHLYFPQVVVVGGGLGRVGRPLLDPIAAHVRGHGPAGLPVEVVAAALGDDAGLAGAAGWRAMAGREVVLHG
jgi:glucokinase